MCDSQCFAPAEFGTVAKLSHSVTVSRSSSHDSVCCSQLQRAWLQVHLLMMEIVSVILHITHRLISLYLALDSSSNGSSSNGSSSSNGGSAGSQEWMTRHAGLIAIAQVNI
jgi:hypothetical protein